MSENKSMTVNDLILVLKELPPNLRIHIQSPEGNLISQGNLFVENKFINWCGDLVFIKCNQWKSYPGDSE